MEQHDYRKAAGNRLREWRENCGITSVDEIRGRVRSPIVQRNIERIEAGQPIALSIYREAIRELGKIYASLAPDRARPYITDLGSMIRHLRR